MGEEQVILVLEEFGVYQELSLRGVFSSEASLLAWVQGNVHGPLSAFRVRPETIDHPGRVARCRSLKLVDGKAFLE